jgi:hypothetical protein
MLFIDINSQLFRKNYFCCNFLKLNLYYDWTICNAHFDIVLNNELIKFVCDFRQVGGFLRVSDKVYQLLAHGRWFSPGTRVLPPLKLVAMI